MEAGFFDISTCDLGAFRDLTAQKLDPAEVPRAARVERNVPVYAVAELGADLEGPARRRGLLSEWARVLGAGAGVLVLKGAVADRDVLDSATAIFEGIIAQERAAGGQGADHFAAAGANDGCGTRFRSCARPIPSASRDITPRPLSRRWPRPGLGRSSR